MVILMKKNEVIHNSGKRKSAIARATLKPGTGKLLINHKSVEAFANSKLYQDKILEPFTVLGGVDKFSKYDIIVNTIGGGQNGQAEAIRVAISKCLAALSEEYKEKLGKYDRSFLIPDTRRKETRKPNKSKARAKRQKSYR